MKKQKMKPNQKAVLQVNQIKQVIQIIPLILVQIHQIIIQITTQIHAKTMN